MSIVNSEYDVEDSLKQDSTKDVYKRAAKFLLSSSEDTLPGLYRNKSRIFINCICVIILQR